MIIEPAGVNPLFELLPVSLFAGQTITPKLQEVDPAFDAKEKDNGFTKEVFPALVDF